MSDQKASQVESRVSLRVVGDELEPSEVTGLLNLEPDRCHRRGDLVTSRASAKRKSGYWSIQSARHVSPKSDVGEHVAWLMQRVGEKSAELSMFRSKGWIVDIWVTVFAPEGYGGVTISSDLVRDIAGLAVDLNFSFYGDVEAGEEPA